MLGEAHYTGVMGTHCSFCFRARILTSVRPAVNNPSGTGTEGWAGGYGRGEGQRESSGERGQGTGQKDAEA